MRESFGSGFALKLMMGFIVVYVSFMAVAVNYAKSFRVKNTVINILEQNQYSGDDISADTAIKTQIDNYLAGVPYYIESDAVETKCEGDGGNLTDRGICIVPLGSEASRYYKVVSYISISFPFFKIYMTLPISGETQIIA